MAEHIRQLLGETRRATVAGRQLVALHILRDGDGLQAGARVVARLTKKLGRRGIARHSSEDLLVEPWPAGASEGADVALEIRRAAWREPGRERLAKARPAPASARPSGAYPAADPAPAAPDPWPDWLAEQWDDAFDAATLGLWRFAGGQLVFSLTPACTTVDIDGDGDDLATPALVALAGAIRLWGLGGSLVVDVPHADRARRQQAVAAFDHALAGQSYERTAINGFGLLQIVVPRHGPSILERARLEPTASAAIALLDSAGRDGGTGPLSLRATPAVARWLDTRPHLLARLSQTIGRPVSLGEPR